MNKDRIEIACDVIRDTLMSLREAKKYTALNDTHRFYVSERNIVLERYVEPTEKTKKLTDAKDSPRVSTGEYTKPSWECLGYHRTHAQMLRAFVGSEMRQCDQNIVSLIDKVDELYLLIEEVGGFDD